VNPTTFASIPILQSNVSNSRKNVIRGIHFNQKQDFQAKWVTCLHGEILDVIVDLRLDSPTFAKWEAVTLNPTNGKSVILDSGLGHAFIALTDETIVNYSLTSRYDLKLEKSIHPLDPDIGINWPGVDWILSKKDQSAQSLNQFLEDQNGKYRAAE
jgi:dTDP-4-dehydrorhamnose 3,5-epimerase